MISLCMDSAYKALVLGLYKDGTLIDGVSIEAFKKQSETIFVELNQLFEKTGLDYKDVDEVIITDVQIKHITERNKANAIYGIVNCPIQII